MSSQELLYSFKGKCGATHKATKTVYICKRLTLKKYATTRSIALITIYNKHKHNHHYSHDTSSSLELSQSMPKLISATGSYWNGRIPVAISNFSRKFIRSFVHWNCRSNNANGSRVLSWRHDQPWTLRLQVNSRPKLARSRGYSGYIPCPFCRDILVLFCDS